MISDTKDAKHNYVMRFINTHLAGCEYVIRQGKTLFIVANSSSLVSEQQYSKSMDTIFIPDDTLTTNFEIFYNDYTALPQLVYTNGKEIIKEALDFFRKINVNGVNFALRPEESEWKEIDGETLTKEPYTIPEPKKDLCLSKKILLFLLLLLPLSTAAYYFLMDPSVEAHHRLLSSQRDVVGRTDTFIGRDGMIYFFANEAKDEAVFRNLMKTDNITKPFTVLYAKAEGDKIVREFISRWPKVKFHGIRFDNPTTPEILLSLERAKLIDQSELDKISVKLASLFSWVDSFTFSYLSDAVLIEFAEQGLQRIVKSFGKKTNVNGITFIIDHKINDNELHDLNIFISEFKKRWTNNYINFDFNLKNEKFGGKSLLYGENGYIKVNDNQWFFPSNQYRNNYD